MVKSFPENKVGRDFCVSDIHGYFDLFEIELTKIDFDETKDRMFSVGDIVNRGPKSEDALIWLAKPWFHSVRGNHEEMAMDYEKDVNFHNQYVQNGGYWFLSLSEERQQPYLEAFKKLPLAIEVETKQGKVGIVHAECPVLSWDEFKADIGKYRESALYSRKKITVGNTEIISGICTLIVGHTGTDEIQKLGNTIYIDTRVCFGGKLTVVPIPIA